MFNKITIAGLTLAALATFVFAETSQAQLFRSPYHRYDAYKHLDDMAVALERQSTDLHKLVHVFFRSSPSYRHLDSDVAEMEKLAHHVHDVAHRRGSIKHLRHDIEEMDKLFHHIEDLVYGMVRTRQISVPAFVTFRRSLSRIGSTLHHMREDLRHLDHSSHYHGHYSFHP